jgi:hypothetical protein
MGIRSHVSYEMIYPLLPSFLTQQVGAPGSAIGVIEGLAAGVVSVLTVWSGWRSDVTNRRLNYIRFGYGLPIFGKAIFVFA